MKAHDGREFTFRPRTEDRHPTCSYCGSVTVATAIQLLQTPGTQYSGADWKYGYPHKFYLTAPDGQHYKFYTVHLQDSTPEEVESFNEVSTKWLGVTWGTKPHPDGALGVFWQAHPGHQSYGTVQ